MLSCLIYTFLTLLVPLRKTYQSLKQPQPQSLYLWGLYWSIFALHWTLARAMPCLCFQPIQLVSVLAFCWLYHEDYQGALVIGTILRHKIETNPAISQHLNNIAKYAGFLNIFESEVISGNGPKKEQ